jgi:lipooligosaccharide transport system ATP-binding protein
MDKGKILVEGAPADLVKQYVGEEIVEVENSAEILSCLVAHNIPHEVTGDTVQIATGSSREIAKILLDSCQPKKMLTRLATLEDVFLKLTGRTLRD